MKLIPLYDQVLILPDEAKEEQQGIFIPEHVRAKPKMGTVMAVGHGRILPNGEISPLMVVPGNRVRYDDYAGTTVEIDGLRYLHMREQAIVAIVLEE